MHLKRLIETINRQVFNTYTDGSFMGLHKIFIETMFAYVNYDNFGIRSVLAVLRLIWNAYTHIDDVVKSCELLFKNLDEFEEYILKKYPLIYQVFRVVRTYKGIKTAYQYCFDKIEAET